MVEAGALLQHKQTTFQTLLDCIIQFEITFIIPSLLAASGDISTALLSVGVWAGSHGFRMKKKGLLYMPVVESSIRVFHRWLPF